MNQNPKDKQRLERGSGSGQPGGGTKQGQQDQEHRPGRGSQHGSGDSGEQQDQEEFDRGGQRHGQHGDRDRSQGSGH